MRRQIQNGLNFTPAAWLQKEQGVGKGAKDVQENSGIIRSSHLEFGANMFTDTFQGQSVFSFTSPWIDKIISSSLKASTVFPRPVCDPSHIFIEQPLRQLTAISRIIMSSSSQHCAVPNVIARLCPCADQSCVSVDDGSIVTVPMHKVTVPLTAVFERASQDQIYDAVYCTISAALEGLNATILTCELSLMFELMCWTPVQQQHSC